MSRGQMRTNEEAYIGDSDEGEPLYLEEDLVSDGELVTFSTHKNYFSIAKLSVSASMVSRLV